MANEERDHGSTRTLQPYREHSSRRRNAVLRNPSKKLRRYRLGPWLPRGWFAGCMPSRNGHESGRRYHVWPQILSQWRSSHLERNSRRKNMMSGIERDWATRADYGWRGSAARTASKPEFGFQGEAAVVTTLSSTFLTRSTLFCSPMNSVPTPISPRS